MVEETKDSIAIDMPSLRLGFQPNQTLHIIDATGNMPNGKICPNQKLEIKRERE